MADKNTQLGGLQRTLDLRSLIDLGYLEGMVDSAPRLLSRSDIPDALTDWWRQALRGLLNIAKESAS